VKLLTRIRSGIVDRYKQWTFRPYVIERHVAGETIQFLVGDLFGESWYGPNHELLSIEYEWIKANGIRPGDVVVDCGANHGFSTTLFAKWTGPNGRVHALEPLSHNMAILKKNLRLNGITNAVTHQAAAGACSGNVAISDHPNAAIVANPKGNRRTEQVTLVALDDVMRTESVSFLKVDVEGYELEVLKGARRILSQAPRLAVELHVCMYRDKSVELRQIFELLPLQRYQADIQLKVDGPIAPFVASRHTVETLSKCDVIHLFCS
jgi:FkbM family methyltransferase